LSREEEESSTELKREVGIWGSFSMGYADVGADIYVILGVIILFAGVASPIAFGIAAVVYVSTGLCYAELATKYPVAGGGQDHRAPSNRPS
jgi:APA family basic amino acid/polyamine antiporter